MKDTYYFSHDTNAKNDPKIMAMRNVYGSKGYGWYWIIVETMAEQSNYKLEHKKWVTNALAMAMQCDYGEVEKFIEDCIEEFDLFKSNGERFWSERLLRNMANIDEKRKVRSEAGKKGAEARWSKEEDNKEMANASQTHAEAIAKNGILNNNITDNNKEKENNKKEEQALPPYTLTLSKLILDSSPIKNPSAKQIEAGAKVIHELERIDGYSPAEISAVINFGLHDSFWRTNLQSGASLRKRKEVGGLSKFQKIMGKMQNSKPEPVPSYMREMEE
jgi:hypothetical protein